MAQLVTVIDTATNSVTATVPLPSRPWGIAINHRVDRDLVTGSIPVPSRPWAVAVIPETNRIYVVNKTAGTG